MMEKPTDAAMRAARKLRMRIHNMPPDDSMTGADNPANRKWLDSVTPGDAYLIDEATGLPELIKALEGIEDFAEERAEGAWEIARQFNAEGERECEVQAMNRHNVLRDIQKKCREALAKVKGRLNNEKAD